MTHPFVEVAAATAVVVAVGAGTMLVLPRPKPEPPVQTIVLDIDGQAFVRAEPSIEKTDAERVEDLRRQLVEIAAEQKRLTEEVEAAVNAEPSLPRQRRGGKAP